MNNHRKTTGVSGTRTWMCAALHALHTLHTPGHAQGQSESPAGNQTGKAGKGEIGNGNRMQTRISNINPLQRLVRLLMSGLAALCMCCLLFSGCSSQNPDMIRIPYYDSVQSEILAEAVRQVLVDNGYEAKTVEAGSYRDMQTGLMGGTLDIYADYTSRAWAETLNHNNMYTSTQLPRLKEEFQELDTTWLPLPHIIGSQTLGVHVNIVEENNLKTLSDLQEISNTLKLGADRAFLERKEGYPLFQGEYDINFKTTSELPESVQYDRLSDREIDVMPISSLDGRLLQGRVVTLKDDLDELPQFTGGLVIRNEILEKFPELEDTLYGALRNINGKELQQVSAMVLQNGTSVESAATYLLNKAQGRYVE